MDNIHVKFEEPFEGEAVLRVIKQEAEKALNPTSFSAQGNIYAPLHYVEAKGKELKPKSGLVEISFSKGIIKFTDDLLSPVKLIITGSAAMDADLVALGINTGKTYTLATLREALRKVIRYFPEKDEYNEIIKATNNFNAKYSADINQQRSQDGSKNQSYSKQNVLGKNVFPDFTLKLPIYSGVEESEFAVNIWVETNEGNVSLTLESNDLAEQMKVKYKDVIDKIDKDFRDKGFPVIITD